ncbi:MAG: hypothetical protein AAB972_03535 [Patescibacteria group bacterium]
MDDFTTYVLETFLKKSLQTTSDVEKSLRRESIGYTDGELGHALNYLLREWTTRADNYEYRITMIVERDWLWRARIQFKLMALAPAKPVTPLTN